MASREAGTGDPAAAETAILVVDDEPEVASVTAQHLARHFENAGVAVAEGGAAALERMCPDFDCVVSDYEMPEMDGLELLRQIRESHTGLPFILFTARGSEEIASEAISAGVTDYLQKGVGTDQYAVLANRIENAVARRESEAVAAETRTRYRRLLESLPNAVGVHDGDTLLFANQQLVRIAGVDGVEDLEGEDPLTFISEEDRADVATRMQRVMDGNRVEEWVEFCLIQPDGEGRHVEARAAPVQFDGAAASQFVLRDVTDRRRHEERIRSLHDATRELVTAETPSAVADVTLRAVRDVFNEPIACLWTFDPAAGELVPVGATAAADELAREEGLEPDELSLPDWTVEMTVFEAGEQRVIDEYGEREDGVANTLESVLMHPLGGHGLLTIGATDPDHCFDRSQRDLVGILARSTAAALDRVGATPGEP